MAGAYEITTGTVAEACKLLGIEFDEPEREQILEALPLLSRLYERARQVELPNELGPALRFDPRLPGMSFPREAQRSVRSTLSPGALPTDDEEIAFAPVTRLSRWIESGALSSTRLTEIYLERLERFGQKLECVVASCEERALAAARGADEEIAAGRHRGPLHGIPWGAKDLLDTAGIATSWGTAPYRDRVPERDAEVVRRLDRAGAVLVAKLTLGELAYGDVWFGGQTRNPWKPSEGSGGSSAGSGAATAAGLVGFAIGSETLGSIANPCMVCGTTGLRPTFGRVPRSGAMALCWSLDKLGPIARSVEDTALVLADLHGSHPGDPDALDLPFSYDATAGVRGRRIGYVPAHFEGGEASEPERGVLERLRGLGAELVEIALPDLPHSAVYLLVWVEAAAAFQELLLSGRLGELKRQDARAWPNQFRTAHLISAVDYVQLQRIRHRLMHEMHALIEDLDAVVAPGMGHALSLITNATGHPALTQRVGFRDDGTPVAVTLHGRLFDEGALVAIGTALERDLDVWDRRPDLRNLE